MLSSEVAQALKSYGHFSGSPSVTAMLDFSGKANTPIRGLGEDDTASSTCAVVENATILSSHEWIIVTT